MKLIGNLYITSGVEALLVGVGALLFLAGIVAFVALEYLLAISFWVGSFIVFGQFLIARRISSYYWALQSTIEQGGADYRAKMETLLRTEYRQLEALLGLHRVISTECTLPALRGWPASPDFIASVITEIQTRNAEKLFVVECGSGASTVFIGLALKQGGQGRLLSLEHDLEYYEKTKRELVRHGLEEVVSLRYAPLTRKKIVGAEDWLWYDVSADWFESKFNILVVDGPPSVSPLSRYPAIPLMYQYKAASSVVILDDGAREGEQAIVRRWRDEGYIKEVTFERTETGLFRLILN